VLEAVNVPGSGPSFNSVRSMVTDAASARVLPSGKPAKLVIQWGDPQFPIFFWLMVNGQTMPPPHFGEGGVRAVDIVLKDGPNRLDWGIRHTGQGWLNEVWLQIGSGATRLLKADRDPSPGTGDDLSTEINRVVVA
jgi:hypothetical protein